MPKPGMVLREYKAGDYTRISEEFIRLFGDGTPEYRITKDGVERVLSRLLVEGKPYGERYGIEVNASNLEATVSHVIHNLAYGEIGSSFRSENPLRAVLVGEGENSEVTPLIPPNPHPHPQAKPAKLSGWVRFWGRFGFYREKRAGYEEKLADYRRQQRERNAYSRNENAMRAYADLAEREEWGI
ncbi:MAG: hypothetical protein LUC99_00865 [Clostridiales bacterium]|nr:hypothetical protein [Clostridiales bacterium]